MIRFLFVLILALFTLFTFPTQAQVPVGFEPAVAAFEADQHEAARTAFERMSRAGLAEAQFNLGAMLLNGQGGETNVTDGAAWIQVAAENGFSPAREVAESLSGQLSAERMVEVDKRAADLAAEYGRQALLDRHRPRVADAAEPDSDSNSEEADSSTNRGPGSRLLHSEMTLGEYVVDLGIPVPRYPSSALRRNTVGFVRLAGWVEPSGEILHGHVVSAYPEGVFDRDALKSFNDTQAKWLGDPPDQAQFLTRTISFWLEGATNGPFFRELQQSVDESEHDLEARYRLIWITENLALGDQEFFDLNTIVNVTHQAAIAGVTDAQIDIARKLRSGKQLEEDAASANFWLKQAAFEGDAQAAFELSQCDLLDGAFRRDLRRAAIEQDHLSALIAEIRELVANPEQARAEDMAALLERLPRNIRRNSDDPILTQARQIAAG